MNLITYTKEIWRGKDTYRILMNNKCKEFTLQGKVLDLGSGKNLASYHRFFKKSENTKIVSFDLMMDQAGRKDMEQLDFEKDPLPVQENSVDVILAFNLLEHLYDSAHLLVEIKRVLKGGGEMIGSVPFLVGYHADPHDYWRYTSEALKKIFSQNGFTDIKIEVIGRGPFVAGFSQVEFVFSRIIKILFAPFAFLLDKIFFALKIKMDKEKFALGLFFVLKK